MVQTINKDELTLISEIMVNRFTKTALIDAITYFSTDDSKELAGMFIKSDDKVVFKPFNIKGSERTIELETTDYKKSMENNTLLGFAHSHPNNESLNASEQDLMQAKFSIHDFLIFKPHNFKEFTFIGAENDHCKKLGLVGVQTRLNL